MNEGPTKENLAVYFPEKHQPAFKAKKPHQRARLVRIAQVREEMARVYNYMLRGFNAPFVQLQADDPVEWRRRYPEGFILTAEQAKACTLILKEVAALVHSQAIEAKLDILKENIKRIIAEQGLAVPDFLEETPQEASPEEAESWASEEIEEADISDPNVIEMVSDADKD